MSKKTGFEIENGKEIERLFKLLDMTDKAQSKQVRTVMKAPFNTMKADAKTHLKAQGSVVTGNLYRGLSVGSNFNKRASKFGARFGGRTRESKTNHIHFVNSGTVKRKRTGAVGKARTNYKNRNTNFRLGFADRAIKVIIPSIPDKLSLDLSRIVEGTIRKNPT